MATLSPLCSICTDILEGQNLNQHWPELVVRHHLDFDSFSQAVRSKCYICTIVWKCHFTEKRSRGQKRLRGMGWSWQEEECEDGVVNFSIQVYPKGDADYAPKRVTFRMVRCEGFKFSGHSSLKTLAPSTSSLSSLGVAYSWYLSCRAIHKSCHRLQRDSKWFPTRLIDVGVPRDLTWKLHICAEEKMRSPSYMTLSYRWGSLPSLRLMQSNIDELRRGKLIDELPQTFRDAVVVLHRFSVRYLWIDSLCIMQDSLEDWERESSTMHDVYANSSCNISAIASSDPSGGLFRDHHREAIQPGLVTMKTGPTQDKYYIFDDSYWDRQVTSTVLNHRGWVFQERLLAPRVLHFAAHQIFWECFREQKCEAFAVGIPWQTSLKSFEAIFNPEPRQKAVISDTAFCLWLNLVESYTQCALTKPGDKLVAFSGLAHLFREATGDDYLGGLWRSRLADSLHWQADQPMRKSSDEYVAPTWSWACGSGPIKWERPRAGYHSLLTVVDARTQSPSSDLTGRVLGGSITVQGLLLHATCEETVIRGRQCVLTLASEPAGSNDAMQLGKGTELPLNPGLLPNNSPQFVIASLYEDFAGTNLGDGRKLHFLVLHAQLVVTGGSISDTFLEGLLLDPALSSSDQFVRLGNFQIRGRENAEKCGVCVSLENNSAWLSEKVEPNVITIV